MIGLAVIAGVALYIGICWLIVRALKQRWAKALAILIVLAIPFWDWPIGYYNFHANCAREGGIHIKQNFPPVSELLVDAGSGYTGEDLIRRGFKVIDIVQPNLKVKHYYANGRGLPSSYDLSSTPPIKINARRNQLMPWHLLRNDLTASRSSSGEVLVTHTAFHWRGMWWQVMAAPMFGVGAFCHTQTEESLMAALLQGSNR